MLRIGKFIIFLTIIALISGCSSNSGGITLKKGTLIVGIEIGYPPMEYMADDGITPVGFDISLAKAIADKMGLKVQFVDTAWEGIFAGVNTGRYDCIISSVTIIPERLVTFNFSKPYIKTNLALVMLKNTNHNVRSPLDLWGLGVAYQEATTSDYYMRKLGQEGLKYIPYEYDKVMYCFEELRLGRVDAVMTDLLVANEYLARSDIYEIVWHGIEEEFGICMKKGNDELTEEINRALDELFENGTILRISMETFNGKDYVSAVRSR